MPDEMTRLRVGNAYRERREELGYSMADLRSRGAPSDRVISEFENGKSWPSGRTQSKLCLSVGWSPDSIERLARGAPPLIANPQTTDPTLREIMDELQRLRAIIEERN